ncbi:MAG: HAD family hydrolase [Acidimicrobiia bacterium]
MPTPNRAVLFDVDGTLVDTNWFHTLSWWRVFRKAGEDVPMSRIHPLIGMGSDQLLEAIFGEEREDLRGGHSEEFEPFMREIHAFPRAGDLLRAVKERSVQVVLCTSSKKDHLEPMLEAVDAMDAIDEIVNADDVDRSKPAPDVFTAALEKTALEPDDCLVVGDTAWDVEAAKKAGIETVCVLTGGTSREELLEAGAVEVYEDVAELLSELDNSPLERLFDAT